MGAGARGSMLAAAERTHRIHVSVAGWRYDRGFVMNVVRHTPLSALVLLLGPAVVARAAQPLADQVDERIRAEMRRQNIPGLSVAVVRDGRIIKAQGYGLADPKREIPATPETVYKIASVSKQFIATGIMLLIQDGRL